MTTAAQIAKHFKDVHFGGNWTCVNMKDTLENVDWQQATTTVYNLNTIAALVFHINYYVGAISSVMQGMPLEASDKFSFDVSQITSEAAWQDLVNKTYAEAEQLATLIENIADLKLSEAFTDPKYGSYYRNLQGVTEHTHYHLGQIVLIRKILNEMNQDV